MRREIRDAPNRVTLDLDVGGEHLADEGFEASEFDDRELVFGCASQVSASGRRRR